MKTQTLLFAVSLLAAGVQQAHACGDSPHSLGALSFDGALQLDVSVVSFANFHTCDSMHQVGNQHLESGHVTFFAGDGQTFDQLYVYDLPLGGQPLSPTHRVTQTVTYQPGIYAAHADGYVTFSFDSFDTHLDINTFEFVTVTSHHLADMYFYNAATTVAAVPEPQSYALMIAGLGLMGWRARKAVRP